MHRSIDPDSLGFLFTDVARHFRAEFDRRIVGSGVGLTAGEARTLAHVAAAEGERQNVIAERLNIAAMSLSAMIDRLEARGLVERETDPTDRRAKCLRATDRAGDILAQVTAIARAIARDAAEGIDPADWATMTATLRVARSNLVSIRAASVAESDAA